MYPSYHKASCCLPANAIQFDSVYIKHLHVEVSGLVPGVTTDLYVIPTVGCSQAGGGWTVVMVVCLRD